MSFSQRINSTWNTESFLNTPYSASGDSTLITSSDKEFAATKRIKQGSDCLASPFDALAAWIATKWEVNVLNVIYDSRDDFRAPRLQVILEHQHDAEKFRSADFNFDANKQASIAKQFIELINGEEPLQYDVDGLFVVFSAFAPIAKEEADSKLTDKQIESLQNRIGNPDLWCISRCFGHITFMFYTDEQAAKHEADGRRTAYARRYFAILKPMDEFDYLSVDDFAVQFDSKQNFDDNYQSNWYYYYK